MEEKKETPSVQVMTFYHKDGLVPAWKQAIRFAGQEGRIAILPDIINARLSTKPGSIPWERYFTTLSAEYLGISRGGNPIIVRLYRYLSRLGRFWTAVTILYQSLFQGAEVALTKTGIFATPRDNPSIHNQVSFGLLKNTRSKRKSTTNLTDYICQD